MENSPKNIILLIAKYLSNQANITEINELTKWIGEPGNENIFNEYVRTNYAIEYNMTEFDIQRAKKNLLRKIRKDKSVFAKRRFQNITRYAAIFIVLFGLGYFFQQVYFTNNTGGNLLNKEESITLELDNGMIEIINPVSSKEVRDSKGNIVGQQEKTVLTYKSTKEIEKLVFNKLKVPYGKRFEVQLSDGSIVYLNAGTTLRFPVKFIEGKDRQVYLQGEAYFDVAEDKEHAFKVNADQLNVQVFGTEFNVQVYPEDATTYVVLTEGSVGMFTNKQTIDQAYKLEPGERGEFNHGAYSITSQKVNTTVYTSWRNGELVFREMTFKNIIKKLERHYNVVIKNENDALNKEVFNASFNNETIETVLGYFKDITDMDYKVQNNTILIK